VPEVDPQTIEERFTRDLARRQAIIATQYGGDEDAYLDHFFAELNAEYNPPVVVEQPLKLARVSLTDRQLRRTARKAKRYADPRAFPSFKKAGPSQWKFTYRKIKKQFLKNLKRLQLFPSLARK